MIKPIPEFGKLLDKKNSNQFLKPNTPRGPKISKIKFPLFHLQTILKRMSKIF